MNTEDLNVFLTIVEGNIFYGQDPAIKGKPIILHSWTGYLHMYNGVFIPHYLTLNGFHYQTKNMTYVDTFYADYGRGKVLGQHEATKGALFATVMDRYVIH